MTKIAFKLFRVRKDGTLGPLFINRSQRIPLNQQLTAQAHRTKGFAYRPGWHVCSTPFAPHLSKKGRRWYMVKINNYVEHKRPASQGGLWFTAKIMTVIAPCPRKWFW